ncbi:MAG: Ycf66 family protein [Nodosilinea sp.]
MNFGTPVPLLLGIFLVLSAVALFFLDRLKPGYGRDADKIYAILFLISGIFLLGSLTMELIPAFQQMIMVGMLISLMIQNVNSRTPTSNGRPGQPRESRGGYEGDYRPNRPGRQPYGRESRANLRAELDRPDLGVEDPYARPRPMLGGRQEPGYPYDQPRYDQPQPPSPPYPNPPDSPYPNSYDEGPAPIAGGEGSTYASGPPRSDERLRRRRPKTRSDYSDRYGNNPPRPDYRPDRETPPGGWS